MSNNSQTSNGMRQSELFTKTRREAPKDEVSQNAQLLIRAGYIHKEMAGAYSLLPLGFRVFEKIKHIIRDEMNALGSQEVSMTSLQSKELWEKNNRWNDDAVDIWFKTSLKAGGEVGLAWSHEEPMINMMKNHLSSFRDFPVSVYQFQTKLRNELRAKSGIMRGREFVMKDLYSFHRSEDELNLFYKTVGVAYENIFRRMGIGDVTYLTFASGGAFTQFSHEFQTVSTAGEDRIFIDTEKKIAVNEEVLTEAVLEELELDRNTLVEAQSIEVGNIFKFGTGYSEKLGLTFKNEAGKDEFVHVGSYGIGLGRLMGTVVEVLSDEKGIVWPDSITPFRIHVVELSQGDQKIKAFAEDLYTALTDVDTEVLYDDRNLRAGEKFADSDLMGIPYRVIVGKHTTDESIEIVRRKDGEKKTVSKKDLIEGNV